MTNDPPNGPPYMDLAHVSESFADHVRLIHWDGQTARIEFAVVRPHAVGPNRAETVAYPAARLVLTPAALASLHKQLSGLMMQLEREGVLKRIAQAPPQRQ